MNLADMSRYWAREQPGRMALSGDRVLSWARLDTSTNLIAQGLVQAGISTGDRVAVFADNCLEFCQLMVATWKAGAILVPLNSRSSVEELRFFLDDCGASLLVTDRERGELGRAAATAAAGAPRLIVLEERDDTAALPRLLPAAGGMTDDPRRPTDEIALICYTSGTTGFPKGAMLTHCSLWSQATARILISQMTNRDDGYLPFSLSFTGGIAGVYMPLYVVGAGMVLHGRFDPETALRTIQDARITVFSGVPIIWEQMVQHPDFERYDLTSLRSCFSGGAPVPLSLLMRLQEVGIPMSQAYGITEASGLGSVLPSHDAQRKLGSAGRAILNSEIRIVDEGLRELPRGEIGELTIRGPNVMKGYWNRPEATAETLIDGWLRTGDLAVMDEEGCVTLVDRSKDMVISGGLNVYPAEIEKVIAALDHVIETAVIGVPHPIWGETPVAIIRASRPIALTALRELCARELADYKIPRHVVFVDEPMPRNASGKLLKRELRATYTPLPEIAVSLRQGLA